MAARWTSGSVICAGRLREPGEVYDDLPADVIARGLAVDVTDAPVVASKPSRRASADEGQE